MQAIRPITLAVLGCILASNSAADEPRPADARAWCAYALTSIASARPLDNAELRLAQAELAELRERTKWDEVDQDAHAAETARERAILQAIQPARPAAEPVFNNAVRQPGKSAVASKSAKTAPGAVAGNPTGKRVKRKMPVDDGAIPPIIIARPPGW